MIIGFDPRDPYSEPFVNAAGATVGQTEGVAGLEMFQSEKHIRRFQEIPSLISPGAKIINFIVLFLRTFSPN
jgi:hypothetical protein